MSNLVSNMFNPGAPAAAPGPTAVASSVSVEAENPAMSGLPPMGGGFDSIFQS